MNSIKKKLFLNMALLAGFMFIALSLIPVSVSAHTAEKGNLQIIHPWVDAAAQGENATIHPTFMNNDEEKTYVVTGAESAASESVRFLKDGEAIDRITLQPGDILSDEDVTVELVNLKEALETGEVISMTISFSDGTTLDFKLGVGAETMPE
ncbi:MAG: hypothetical protein NZ828_07105 [Alphaproteobacteria bacterium]|jgi:copper(I)-binding protein|nr:hypothetical protein [Alphaproteobacteria bacterium]